MEYWNSETPTVIDTGANVFRYFAEAQKLQVCLPDWTDKEGKPHPGKTVAIDVTALKENKQAVELLQQICK